MRTDTEDFTPALGTIVDEGRGALPYQLIHGESLVACAAWALGEARVTALDLGTPWLAVIDSGEAFVVHDPLCPMTPADFIADCVDLAIESGSVVVGVDAAGAVLSPVVIPTAVAAELTDLPSTDLAELVDRLATSYAVERRVAPAAAARVASAADVAALELLTTPEGA
jgi:2-C-methyl-D-erythritol 4-phosphate cytidylyltransferase